MKTQYVIGVDIGGTNTEIGAVAESGDCLQSRSFKTAVHKTFKTYEAEFVAEVGALRDAMGSDAECIGIGIGAPNGNYFTGAIENPPNLNFGASAPIVDCLKEAFPDVETIHLTNDANAAALGEKVYGGAQFVDDFIMITLGTGLGSGIVINGQLVLGHDGMAAELGHVIVVDKGRQCGCGRRGCLETYCSGTAIVRNFVEMLAVYNGQSSLRDLAYPQLNAKVIEDAALVGDIPAKMAFEMTGKILGKALANFVPFSSPKAIYLFGGPVKAGALLLDPIRKAMEKNMFSLYRNKVSLHVSKLPGAKAAVLGAASLVWHDLLSGRTQR